MVQKAARKGMNRVVGRGRRRCERDRARRCWGTGRSECHMPGCDKLVSIWEVEASRQTEE